VSVHKNNIKRSLSGSPDIFLLSATHEVPLSDTFGGGVVERDGFWSQ
jgi:hypothetical protein